MADIDLSFLRAQLDRIEASQPRLASGGGGPHDPAMEPRVARLESDVGHIRSDIGEIKTLLGRLAPRIDEMYGHQSNLVTQQDLANLRVEIVTRRQTIFDIFAIVSLIGVVLTIGAKLAH
jgi:hypothetical protein